MAEPKTIRVGESLKWWRDEDGTYTSASGYTLKYELFNADQLITITEDTIDGAMWKVEVAASTTEAWVPGQYDWALYAVKSGEKWYLASGHVEILAAAEAHDGRSFWRKIRDALQATLLGKASRDQLSLSISGRSISRMSPSELNEWLDRAQAEVAKEERAAAIADGKTSSGVVRVEF